MTYGTSANTYLVGRTVPFVTAPAERNRPDRQRTVDPAHKKGTYSAYGAFRALLSAPPPQTNPPTIPKDGLQNEPPARPASPPQPGN